MFNTLKNFSRKADRYGDLHFLSFYGSVLSRLAYLNDNNFYKNYTTIMGPVIHPKILTSINSINSDNLQSLLDDQTLYGLDKSADDIFAEYEYQYKEKNFIDFIRLQMPQNINIINNEVTGEKKMILQGPSCEPGTVRYISIGWSNYGEIYVVADKRMPNTILLLFRGTYSAKTAGLYAKPTSVVPLTVCNNSNGEPEKFLYGIFKATSEMIHTIIEAIRFLAWDFLEAREPNSVKIITAGHSLGGAMCTDFAYLWMGVKKTEPYTKAPYNVLADNIVCLSYGAPRCMSSSVAKKFCEFVEKNKILYLRVTTRGDPVPAAPPKMGYQHPCSEEPEMRKIVSEDCNNLLSARPFINAKYDKNLDCQNYKTRVFAPNPLAHTIYLNILFVNAVDIVNFVKGIGLSKEVLRTKEGSTVCRIIMGENNNYSAIFFDVNKARQSPNDLDNALEKSIEKGKSIEITTVVEEKETSQSPEIPATTEEVKVVTDEPATTEEVKVVTDEPVISEEETTEEKIESLPIQPNINLEETNSSAAAAAGGAFFKSPKIGGKIAEDIRMTAKVFNKCIIAMELITDINKCPQSGKMFDEFENRIMPDLSCPGSTFDTVAKDKSIEMTTTVKETPEVSVDPNIEGGKKINKKKTHKKRIHKKRRSRRH